MSSSQRYDAVQMIAMFGSKSAAAELSQGEISCPEKRGDIIAAQRCADNAECPRATTCEHRPRAVEVTTFAHNSKREPVLSGDERKRLRPVRECAACSSEVPSRARTCSLRCAARLAALRGGRSGLSPDDSGREYGYGLAPTVRR